MKEKRKLKILEMIKNFRLIDDAFMSRFFDGDLESTALVLQIIIEKPDLKVLEAKTQYFIKNLQGNSVILDVKATDSEGKIYNIEFQRSNKGAEPKRARYNSALIDANFKIMTEETEKLPSTYVILITENDVLKGSRPIYHIDRIIRETDMDFNDESHIIYVNGRYRSNTPLGMLIHDLNCSDPSEMKLEVLAKRTRYFKEDIEGVEIMKSRAQEIWDELLQEELEEAKEKVLRDGLKQGLEQGIEQGAHEKAVEAAKILLANNIDLSIILKSTGLSEEEINLLRTTAKDSNS